jgi:DNA polymerase V
VTELIERQEAITELACSAAEKLRNHGSHTGQIMAFIRTSPTSDSAHITQTACAILKHIYHPGYKYAKAGVMLMDLQPATRQQLTLDFDEAMPENRIRLMQAMDQINRRYGRGSLVLGSAGGIGAQPVWGMKQERLSSGFTTDWRGLAVAVAD